MVTARVFLARILWLQGFPDQAMRTAESSVEDARAANHGFSFCHALALGACVIALLVGDLAAAEHYVGMLLDHSTRHSLAHWRAFGCCHTRERSLSSAARSSADCDWCANVPEYFLSRGRSKQ